MEQENNRFGCKREMDTNTPPEPGLVLAMCQVSIFSFVRFKRDRGPMFFCFSNMAATPRDL